MAASSSVLNVLRREFADAESVYGKADSQLALFSGQKPLETMPFWLSISRAFDSRIRTELAGYLTRDGADGLAQVRIVALTVTVSPLAAVARRVSDVVRNRWGRSLDLGSAFGL